LERLDPASAKFRFGTLILTALCLFSTFPIGREFFVHNSDFTTFYLFSAPLLLVVLWKKRAHLSARYFWSLNAGLLYFLINTLCQLVPFFLPGSTEFRAGSGLNLVYIPASEADTDSAQLKAQYPYLLEPKGLAAKLFSKQPIESSILLDLGAPLPQILVAKVNLTQSKSIKIFVLPSISLSFKERQLLLRRTASILRSEQGDMVLLCDFDATIFSSRYKKFISWTDFKDAKWGRPWLLLAGLKNIAKGFLSTEQVLYSGGIGVDSMRAIGQGYKIDFKTKDDAAALLSRAPREGSS